MSAENKISWYVARTIPRFRVEFDVLRAINQREHPAMVPFEEKWVQKANGGWDEIKFTLFPCYVFVGLFDWREFRPIKESINQAADDMGKTPPVLGLIGPALEPGRLSSDEVAAIQVRSMATPTQVNIHKALQVGSPVNIVGASPWAGRKSKVEEFTKKGIKAKVEVFNSWHVIEIPMRNVRAA